MQAHRPILVDAVIDALRTDPHGNYIDATFGRGGHTRALLQGLSPNARILVIDRDPTAIQVARALANDDARVLVRHGRISEMVRLAREVELSEIVGVLLDLGVSSPQLDDGERGMSFRTDGPLDMRMDPTTGVPASQWINTASEAELVSVFFEFGEEKYARRIARAIVERRAVAPILRTGDLAALVAQAQPRPDPHKHAATRVFQAIRIHVNEELDEVRLGIEAAFTLIRPGGRIAVLTFHSLEDRIVKRMFRAWSQGPTLPRRLPVTGRPVAAAHLIGRARRAEPAEVAENPRARSALLRVLEKAA
ncbi:MAG TPA: 16S rRNA (cytosine(1402)-N(4))-methyltransferase RsmH [Pseudomonadales bacterium]